jgi:hypothetical protein
MFSRGIGKWLIVGALMIGVVRTVKVLVWGGSLTYVLGTTVVSVALAATIYLILRSARQDSQP